MNFLLQALSNWAMDSPNTIAFTTGGETISYRRLRRRVGGLATETAMLPERVGLLAPNGIDWIVADLAMWANGRTLVPLPEFFADGQLAHILSDGGIDAVLTTEERAARVQALGARPVIIGESESEMPDPSSGDGARIIYTSGSTGNPKGVVLGPAQLQNTCGGLLAAARPNSSDRHLSVLPFSMLLENICGIYLPILVGGQAHIAASILSLPPAEMAVALAETALSSKATTTVLVPQLLTAWVLIASVGRVAVPDSLRFVAVGGAAVPDPIAKRARELGIPAYEGYGLSECCSVVAINVPDADRQGSVGKPIKGLDVKIAADGEIVVRGAPVMQGYLGGERQVVEQTWPTGDLGHLDEDGYLYVQGRKDNLIVTANGRNVSPEWPETMLAADPRVGRAIVLPTLEGGLAAILEPSMLGQAWFEGTDAAALQQLTTALCAEAPDYARPWRPHAVAAGYFADNDLLTANNRPRRGAIREHFEPLLTETLDKGNTHAVL
ncbi:MAG: AMP-binding protein [Rhodospirillaceae bacterium]|nr:AMP-binding protein [Rhodospirillaceae bacterium]